MFIASDAGVNTRSVMLPAQAQRAGSHSFHFFDLSNNHKNEQENFETTTHTWGETNFLLKKVSPHLLRSRLLIKATANGPKYFQLFTTHKTDGKKVPETHWANKKNYMWIQSSD